MWLYEMWAFLRARIGMFTDVTSAGVPGIFSVHSGADACRIQSPPPVRRCGSHRRTESLDQSRSHFPIRNYTFRGNIVTPSSGLGAHKGPLERNSRGLRTTHWESRQSLVEGA